MYSIDTMLIQHISKQSFHRLSFVFPHFDHGNESSGSMKGMEFLEKKIRKRKKAKVVGTYLLFMFNLMA
jgi:hypothetical protein